jgi:G patch domain-containing protein 1
LGSTRPERGEAFGVGVFEGDDPDEDVYRTRTLGGDLIGHTYEIMSEEEEESDGEMRGGARGTRPVRNVRAEETKGLQPR